MAGGLVAYRAARLYTYATPGLLAGYVGQLVVGTEAMTDKLKSVVWNIDEVLTACPAL